MSLSEQFLFTEKYRPQTVEECILPDRIKDLFKGYVADPGKLTSLILSGPPGVGKTSVAKALANELGADIMFINASNERGLDVIRNQIIQFAGTVSMFGADGVRKIVVLDEADGLTRLTQEALRGVFEQFADNAIFILTCNFKGKIIEPIRASRCSEIDFKLTREDRKDLAGKFFKRLKIILGQENIEYDPKILAELIKKYMPDWRKVLNEIQKFSAKGAIDSDILVNLSEESFNDLIGFMKGKNFTKVRGWVTENNDIDTAILFRQFYDHASKLIDPSTIPMLVVILAKYQNYSTVVADQEINTSACLAEIMVDCNFR